MRDTWIEAVRAAFISVARGRVGEEAVEDVVQDALAIVLEKSRADLGAGRTRPPLPWCFRILRNVIGNHYQRERTRLAGSRPGTLAHARIEEFSGRASVPTPIESLERGERSRLLRESIEELAAEDRFCGDHFRSRLDPDAGVWPDRPDSPASTHYVRLFRCREKLRRILVRKGYLP